jgi:hypothetical protein
MAHDDYKWKTDSRDERQSDFTQSSLFATTAEDPARGGARERVAGRRGGSAASWVRIIVIVVAASAAVLYVVANYLHR